MVKNGENISGYLILIGIVLLTASLVFSFYYFVFVLRNDYQIAVSLFQMNVFISCNIRSSINASFNSTECIRQMQNPEVISPYSEVIFNFFMKQDYAILIAYFSPMIMGIAFIIAGLIIGRKSSQ